MTSVLVGRRLAPPLLVTLLALGAGSLTPVVLSPQREWQTIAAVILLVSSLTLVIGGMIVEQHSSVGLRNPGLILFGYLFLVYVARPAFMLGSGSAGTSVIGFMQLSHVTTEFITALFITSVALLAFVFGYFIAPGNLFSSLLRSKRYLRSDASARLAFLLLISSVAAFVVLNDLRAHPVSWQSALTSRNLFFEGRATLVWLLTLYKLGVFVWLAIKISEDQGLSIPTLMRGLLLWSPALGFDLLTGSREELILRNFLPVMVVLAGAFSLHRRSLKSSILPIAAIGLAIILFVGYRAVVRDSATLEGGSSPVAVAMNNLTELPEFILGGGTSEASAFDHFMVTRMHVPANADYRGIETLEVMIKAPVPAGLLDSKPARGSAELTRRLRPQHFARGGNIAFSGAADLYFTAGDVAVIVGLMLIGLLSGATIRSAAAAASGENAAFALIFGIIAAAAFLSVLRADLYSLPFVPIRIGLLVVVFYLLTTPHPSAPREV